ncbi:MAG: hypothetical protein HY399_08940 [Elusimicrobia bacterium]|nr:hypothetical protein [Elusimicrobiota bacterium]
MCHRKKILTVVLIGLLQISFGHYFCFTLAQTKSSPDIRQSGNAWGYFIRNLPPLEKKNFAHLDLTDPEIERSFINVMVRTEAEPTRGLTTLRKETALVRSAIASYAARLLLKAAIPADISKEVHDLSLILPAISEEPPSKNLAVQLRRIKEEVKRFEVISKGQRDIQVSVVEPDPVVAEELVRSLLMRLRRFGKKGVYRLPQRLEELATKYPEHRGAIADALLGKLPQTSVQHIVCDPYPNSTFEVVEVLVRMARSDPTLKRRVVERLLDRLFAARWGEFIAIARMVGRLEDPSLVPLIQGRLQDYVLGPNSNVSTLKQNFPKQPFSLSFSRRGKGEDKNGSPKRTPHPHPLPQGERELGEVLTLKHLRTSPQWHRGQEKEIKERMPTFWKILEEPQILERVLAARTFLRLVYPYKMAGESNMASEVPPIAWAQKTGIEFRFNELHWVPVSDSFRRDIIYVKDDKGFYALEMKVPGQRQESKEVEVGSFHLAKKLWDKNPKDPGVVRPLFLGKFRGKIRLYGKMERFTQRNPLRIIVFEYREGQRGKNAYPFLKEQARRRKVSVWKLYQKAFTDVVVTLFRLHEMGYVGLSDRTGNDLHNENWRVFANGRAVLVGDFGSFLRLKKTKSRVLTMKERSRQTLMFISTWHGMLLKIYPDVVKRLTRGILDPREGARIQKKVQQVLFSDTWYVIKPPEGGWEHRNKLQP